MQAIKIIVAMSKNRVIGINNKLPWHIAEDLKRFKKLTSGYSIIMGRKTYESIGKPLPNRKNIIVTKNLNFQAEGVSVTHSLTEALNLSANNTVFIIGGGQIYQQALPLATHLLITFVDIKIDGDTFFPEIDFSQWQETSHTNAENEEGLSYSFVDLKRII